MKILVVLSRFPYPTDKGDKLRAFHQIKSLSENNEVHLFCTSDEPVHPESIEVVKKFCASIEISHLSKIEILFRLAFNFFSNLPFQVAYFTSSSARLQFNKFIKKVKPDAVYTQLARMAEFTRHLNHETKVIDFQDSFSKGLERRLKTDVWYKLPFIRIETRRLKKYEREIFTDYQSVTIISKQDAELFDEIAAHQFAIVGNGIDTDYYTPQPSDKKQQLLITGNMQYLPTVKAVEFIVNEVLPILKSRNFEVKLVAAGKSPASNLKKLEGPQLHLTGWLDDLRPVFNESLIYCAPLQIGIGVQNKLLEAMSMEMPVITSSLCANALGAEHMKHLIIADDAKSVADAIDNLLSNETLRTTLGKNAREFVKSTFSWKAENDKLETLLQQKNQSK